MFSNFISSIRRFILETSVVVSPYFFVFLQFKFSSWSIALWRSCAALMVLLMTSAAHAKLEGNDIQLQASWWIFAWYGVFCFDQIYIKAVITKVKLPTWSNVYPSSKIRFRSHSVWFQWFVSFGRDLALYRFDSSHLFWTHHPIVILPPTFLPSFWCASWICFLSLSRFLTVFHQCSTTSFVCHGLDNSVIDSPPPTHPTPPTTTKDTSE